MSEHTRSPYVIVVLLAQYSNQQSHGAQYLWKRRTEENQIHHENETSANKKPEMTKSKRRKLEKIKAPVTILRKPQQEKVSTDEEQEIAVKRMLHYIGQMPSQEVFQPPPVPFVSLPTNVVSNVKYHCPTIKSLLNSEL